MFYMLKGVFQNSLMNGFHLQSVDKEKDQEKGVHKSLKPGRQIAECLEHRRSVLV